MKRYTASEKYNLRPVEAGSAREAAEIFATRLARREYGRAGYWRTLRQDAYAADGSQVTFEAFLGRDAAGGGTTGHNVWLSVFPCCPVT